MSFVPVCMNSIVKVEEDKQRRSRRAEKSTRVWKRYCKNRFTLEEKEWCLCDGILLRV